MSEVALHELLADHDPLAVVVVQAGLEMRLQDRGCRLLGLEDERVVLVATLQDDHEAAGPDASDADHLAGRQSTKR